MSNSKPSYEAFIKAYSATDRKGVSNAAHIRSGQQLWNEVKRDHQKLIKTFNELKTRERKPLKIMDMFSKLIQNSPKTTHATTTTTITIADTASTATNRTAEATATAADRTAKTRERPAQQKLKERLAIINDRIASLASVKRSGLITRDQSTKLKELVADKRAADGKVHRMERARLRMQTYRKQKRKTLEELSSQPEFSEALKRICRPIVGRPRIEADQPQLLKSIMDIVSIGAAAHDRRQTETLRTCLTLDQLVVCLKEMGYSLSRTATYYRLETRCSTTSAAKRHVETVPVRLLKATNSLRRTHPDSHFAAATIRHLLDLANLLGRGLYSPFLRTTRPGYP